MISIFFLASLHLMKKCLFVSRTMFSTKILLQVGIHLAQKLLTASVMVAESKISWHFCKSK